MINYMLDSNYLLEQFSVRCEVNVDVKNYCLFDHIVLRRVLERI